MSESDTLQYNPEEYRELLENNLDILRQISEKYGYEKLPCSLILQIISLLVHLLARGQYRLLLDFSILIRVIEHRSEELKTEKMQKYLENIEEKEELLKRWEGIKFLDDLDPMMKDIKEKEEQEIIQKKKLIKNNPNKKNSTKNNPNKKNSTKKNPPKKKRGRPPKKKKESNNIDLLGDDDELDEILGLN